HVTRAAWYTATSPACACHVAQWTALVTQQRGLAWNGEPWQSALLRDLFGPLPFRPVALPPSARMWNEGTVVWLARAAYEVREVPSGQLDRARLGVLADALAEAGADAALVAHLRDPGPHYRGCWGIESLFQKS